MEGQISTLSVKTGNDALTEVAANGICDLRRDVAKSEADIKMMIGDDSCKILTKIGDAECSIIKNDADIAQRNTIHLNAIERDLQNRVLENRAILLDKMNTVERATDEKLCGIKAQILDSERRILDRLAADKLDEKHEVIDSLRHDRYFDRFNHQFALQNQELASLKQMINSVEQTQRFSSKTVQFGAGNVAIPTQTANQG